MVIGEMKVNMEEERSVGEWRSMGGNKVNLEEGRSTV